MLFRSPTTARAPAGEPEAAPVNGPTTLWDGRPMAKEDAPGIADMDEEEKAPAPKGSWLPADDTVATESASRDRAPKTRSKPAAAAPAANAATTIASSTPDKSAKGSPAEARRERAGAMDYSSTWYQSAPDVAAKYAPALAQEAAGNWAQAASLWQALVNDARVDVGQDAALRAGKAWRAAGRTTEALAVVDAGLRRSSANTATRSSLLVLRGEVLAELGRNSESKKALEDADQLDGDR